MNTQELLLKTVFCCMSCDGDIADEEVALLNEIIKGNEFLGELDVKGLIDKYVEQINQQGIFFLSSYLDELGGASLSKEDQLTLVNYAIKTIEADNIIKYQEISFFKKIRKCLSVSDEEIAETLKGNENIETYLLPDIDDEFDVTWAVSFDNINVFQE